VRIAQLAERLARVEERLSRLVIARETVDEVLSEVGADVSAPAEPEVTGATGARSRACDRGAGGAAVAGWS
jgi:hypothetical protein